MALVADGIGYDQYPSVLLGNGKTMGAKLPRFGSSSELHPFDNFDAQKLQALGDGASGEVAQEQSTVSLSVVLGF